MVEDAASVARWRKTVSVGFLPDITIPRCRIGPGLHDFVLCRPARARPCSGKHLLVRRQLAMKPALRTGHGINVDLRLVDVAALCAPQGPLLKAGTRRDSALDCHAGLASRSCSTAAISSRRSNKNRSAR